MKILNTVIPILMRFYSLVLQVALRYTSSYFADILWQSQIFYFIQSYVARIRMTI